jgi:hypothetical protein
VILGDDDLTGTLTEGAGMCLNLGRLGRRTTELFGTTAAQSDGWHDLETISLKVSDSAGFLCVVINQKICMHHERYFHAVISAVH